MNTDDRWPTRVSDETILLPVSENHLGISAGFLKRGYCLIKEECADLIPEITGESLKGCHLNRESDSEKIRSVLGIHKVNSVRPIVERLQPLAESILNCDVYVHQSRINLKHPNGSSGWSWHSDFETWHSKDGMPDPHCLSAMVALDDNTSVNGSLEVLTTSHTLFWGDKKGSTDSSPEAEFTNQTVGVPPESVIREYLHRPGSCVEKILMRKGDVLFFHSNLLHTSKPNLSDEPRKNLFIVFNSTSNRLTDPYDGSEPRPEYMASRGK